jgi:hypothetical protein
MAGSTDSTKQGITLGRSTFLMLPVAMQLPENVTTDVTEQEVLKNFQCYYIE